MLIFSHNLKVFSMGICSYIHLIKDSKVKFHWKLTESLTILSSFIFCWNVFGFWVRIVKVTIHFMFFQSLFGCRVSYVALPSNQGHVSPKACHTGFDYTSPSMDGDSSNPSYLQNTRCRTWGAEGDLSLLPAKLWNNGWNFGTHWNSIVMI